MDDLTSKLSEIRSEYNCFDEGEEPYYRALSEAIRILSRRADGDTISRQAAIDALKNDMASLDHIINGMSANDVRLDAYVSQRNQVNYDIYTINNLPAAQPEHLDCGDCIESGGDYECDHAHCHKGKSGE